MRNYLILCLVFPCLIHAQSPVTHSAGMGDNLPSLACLACAGAEWNNVSNIKAEDDSVATTVLNPGGNCFMSFCSYSRYLYASHFNFAIPSDAVIDSIFVGIKRSAHDQNTLMDSTVQLSKRGMLTGNNLKSPDFWPMASAYERYGHNDPLWGTTWLPSDFKDTATGVALKVVNLNTSDAKADVDHIEMTVYYSTSTGINSITSSPSKVEWLISPEKISVNIFTSSSVIFNSKIINIMGQEMISAHQEYTLPGDNLFNFSTESLEPGIYFMIVNAGRKIFAKEFVKME